MEHLGRETQEELSHLFDRQTERNPPGQDRAARRAADQIKIVRERDFRSEAFAQQGLDAFEECKGDCATNPSAVECEDALGAGSAKMLVSHHTGSRHLTSSPAPTVIYSR